MIDRILFEILKLNFEDVLVGSSHAEVTIFTKYRSHVEEIGTRLVNFQSDVDFGFEFFEMAEHIL